MWNSYQRICLRCYMLLLQANMATLVYGILSQAIMFAQLCVPTVGVIYVTCEIWVYEICFYFLSFFCRVISIIRKGLTFRLPGGVVSYPSMLCPRGRAFRGCPTSGSLTFLLMYFYVSNGRECIMYTTPCHSGGKPARTFTTLLVWGPLVTSDLWACHVVNISTTDMLDN